MAKTLSKSQIAAAIAEKNEISKKTAVAVLDQLAGLAYKNAKNTFTLPGIGKLVLVNRPPREMTMRTTHVYRYTRARWHLVHRHADFPPRDQRQDRAA